MSIDEFVKKFESKNNIVFKRLDEFNYSNNFDSLEEATKKFKEQNPAKEIPEGYVVTDFGPDEYVELVNLDTLVKVSITDKNIPPFIGVA